MGGHFFFFSNIVFSSEKDRTQTYFVTTLRDHWKTVNTRLALNVWEKEWSWENCRNGFRSVLKLKWMTEPEILKRNHVPLCSTFILWLWGRVSDRMCLKGLKLGNLMLKVWQRASNYILGRWKRIWAYKKSNCLNLTLNPFGILCITFKVNMIYIR